MCLGQRTRDESVSERFELQVIAVSVFDEVRRSAATPDRSRPLSVVCLRASELLPDRCLSHQDHGIEVQMMSHMSSHR